MKIVINGSYGGFSFSKDAAALLNISAYDADEAIRTNPAVVALVEDDPKWASGSCAELEVVEIPDEATDYMINEYDGLENVIYVLNGKIHFA